MNFRWTPKYSALTLATLLVILAIILSLSLCRTKEVKIVEEATVTEEPFRIRHLYDRIDIVLKAHSELGDQSRFIYTDTLRAFYKSRRYNPLWIEYLFIDSLNHRLTEFLHTKSLEEGLDPSFYMTEEIQEVIDSLPFRKGEDLYHHLAMAELLVSDNLLKIHKDHVIGRVDPVILYGSYFNLPVDRHEEFQLMDILDAGKFKEVFDSSSSRDSNYVRYKLLLADLYELEKTDTAVAMVDTTGITKLMPGDGTRIMPQIAAKLVQMGIITEEEALKADSLTYNKSFMPFILRAQQWYGLHDDGVIGSNTLRFFNMTYRDKIEMVMANMERVRWVRMPKERPFVLVNIPEFMLYMYYPEDSVKSMKVCIGKPKPANYETQMAKYKETGRWYDRPKDHETPQIYSQIEYFVLNPTWTVPQSIVAREMYWQMRKDPFYLRNGGYKVFYKTKELNPDTIDWSKYRANRIPFRFVQVPGEVNALGQIKYIFRNPFFIYLHDTPQKSKFLWSRRAVSHGCVRIEKPLDFGEFVLYQKKNLNYDDFRIMLGHPPMDEERLKVYDPLDTAARVKRIDDTKIEYLDKTIPLYFLYRTVFFTDGEVQFRNDVYNKNAELIRAIYHGDERQNARYFLG